MSVGIELFNKYYEVYLFKQKGSKLIYRFDSLKAAKKCVKLIIKDLYHKKI